MNKRNFKHYLSYLPLTLLSSCATIMHGTNESVSVSSEPSQAEVWVDNKYVGLSPTIVHLSRKDNHFIKIQLEGYEPYEVALTRQLSGWVFGNILFGQFVGLAVDAITGGIYKLSLDQVQAQLRKIKVAASDKGDAPFIAVVMKADPSWEKVGSLSTVH
jgi:hypothetical protein